MKRLHGLRREIAVQLRAQGLSYREIAYLLGVGVSSAYALAQGRTKGR